MTTRFALACAFVIAACGEHGYNVATPDRPGLGTTFGETVYAPVQPTPFERASAAPWAELVLHYNDEAGIAAHAAYLGAPAPLEVPIGDGALTVSLVDARSKSPGGGEPGGFADGAGGEASRGIDDAGRELPGIAAGDRTLVVGEDGARYRIVVRNTTDARFEIVASVDGLDVIDGHPASPDRRGYLVDPHDSLTIDGFRTSGSSVAAFRFGRVADSYAARTTGDRDVGVIGLAFFAERGARWTDGEVQRRDSADPFPGRGYASPPM